MMKALLSILAVAITTDADDWMANFTAAAAAAAASSGC